MTIREGPLDWDLGIRREGGYCGVGEGVEGHLRVFGAHPLIIEVSWA